MLFRDVVCLPIVLYFVSDQFMFYETLLSMCGTQEYKLKWKNTF